MVVTTSPEQMRIFKQHALKNGDFKTTVHEDISEYVVDGVANDPVGIGYSGIGWKTSQVRTLPSGNGGTFRRADLQKCS